MKNDVNGKSREVTWGAMWSFSRIKKSQRKPQPVYPEFEPNTYRLQITIDTHSFGDSVLGTTDLCSILIVVIIIIIIIIIIISFMRGIYTYIPETMSVGNTLLQLFGCYCLWCLYV
jgi:hypothetical protein